MPLFWTCPDCKSNLDHGEKCNCQKHFTRICIKCEAVIPPAAEHCKCGWMKQKKSPSHHYPAKGKM